MTLSIYNTFTRTKAALETIEPGVVRMYVCGVTVYDSSHVGHAMSYLVFDAVRRYLVHRGYKVRYVQNFTDVDDKIIRRANELGVSAYEVADRFATEFLVDTNRLGILPADIYPRVSSEMPAIVGLIERLIERGHAYAAHNGDVYFSVPSFPDYGHLSRRSLEEASSQEEANDFKRHPTDFALWKAAKPGEPSWESPWGQGRPGWHIECSAMSQVHLGDQIDIHGGGLDLVFPHHENEIAQSEAACGCGPFARIWMHHGLLQFSGEKMSKSLGNIVSIGTFLEQHDPEALRLFVLSSHYRGSLTLSDESIAAAERGLERLRGALRPAHASAAGTADGTAGVSVGGDDTAVGKLAEEVAALDEAVLAAEKSFHECMDDDFGTPGALAALFGLVTALNRARDAGAGSAPLEAGQARLVELAGVLGFRLREGYEAQSGTGGLEAGAFIDLLIELRNAARAERNWAQADRIRDRLGELGVALEDGAGGTTWRVG